MTRRSRKPRTDTVYWINKGWQPIGIGYVPSAEAWAIEVKRWNIINEPWPFADRKYGGFANVITDRKDGSLIGIYVFIDVHDRLFIDIVGTIVHESAHVWQSIRRVLGVEKPDNETDAYALQHISVELINAVVLCHPLVKHQ